MTTTQNLKEVLGVWIHLPDMSTSSHLFELELVNIYSSQTWVCTFALYAIYVNLQKQNIWDLTVVV